jgi:hypothetical protein
MKRSRFFSVIVLAAAVFLFVSCEQITGQAFLSPLKGTVTITGTPRVGGVLTATAEINDPEKTAGLQGIVNFKWQGKTAGEDDDWESGWEDIHIPLNEARYALASAGEDTADTAGYTFTSTYTLGSDEAGKYIRVLVSAAGYSGSLAPDKEHIKENLGPVLAAASASYAVITAAGIKNGRVTANPARAAAGETVTLAVSPASGYTLAADSLAVSGASGTVSAAGSGNIWTFTMPAGPVTVTAGFEALPAGTFSITTAALPAAGGVIAAALNAAAEETVTLELKANPGYTLSGAPLVTYGESETVTVSGSGAYYTFTMPAAAVTVTAEFAAENTGGQEPGPESALTANVSYVPTSDDVEWLATAWTGYGTAAETWGLSVTEMPVVYFSVSKTAAQTVTAGGTDAGLVERAQPGAIWDGAEASDTLAVFKVNANKPHNGKEETETYDEWYDSMFEGDDFQFTLDVSEAGKDGKTVTVNLRQNVDLTKAAVFIVTGEGNDRTLTRQTGMKWYQGNNGDNGNHAPFFDEHKEGTRLIDMLVWIDRNLDKGAEYLVRVAAANEAMPSTAITYGSVPEGEAIAKTNAPAGKIRLRGAGNTERVIKHDGADRTPRSNAYFKYIANSQSYIDGLITLWAGGTLQLEKNITIEGDTLDNGKTKVSRLISLYRAHLIMKDGSIIRKSIGKSAIYMEGGSNDTYVGSQLTMEGGQITGNIGTYNPIYAVLVKKDGYFTNTGGTVDGNFASDGVTPHNGINWNGTFVSFD